MFPSGTYLPLENLGLLRATINIPLKLAKFSYPLHLSGTVTDSQRIQTAQQQTSLAQMPVLRWWAAPAQYRPSSVSCQGSRFFSIRWRRKSDLRATQSPAR